MDWVTSIQDAINYIEAHLTETVDYEAVARTAASSVFHFQRMFGLLLGYTLGDYIRMRRLTLAAQELQSNSNKIIDIALKYGYDTSESFSRAFMRFHGISPTEARRGGEVKSFSRTSVKLILYGGNFMDYRIEKLDAFNLICKKKRVLKLQGDVASEDISAFWNEVNANGLIKKVYKYANFKRFQGLIGVCFTGETADSFPYGIGAEYNGVPLSDDEFELVKIPARTFAVFKCRGKMPEAFAETYRRICTEFFPQNSAYEYDNSFELEVYPSAEVENSDYACEIWVAVNEK